ncbi:hypothetical protein [Yoonia sp. MH D7]
MRSVPADELPVVDWIDRVYSAMMRSGTRLSRLIEQLAAAEIMGAPRARLLLTGLIGWKILFDGVSCFF